MWNNDKQFSAAQVKQALVEWTVAHSGFEDRSYLGMSQISECPRVLYDQLVNGRTFDVGHHLMCYAGYLWEKDVKARLRELGMYAEFSEREVVAEFDERFRGHTDGDLRDGSLLEIKSTTQERIERIRETQRIPTRHFEQVQMYLRHGGYGRAMVVYIARDTDELYVAQVRPVPEVADKLDRKARDVLAAVEAGVAPLCTCGRCKA
jgi:hypothetical protein